jgi:hypothetical protein
VTVRSEFPTLNRSRHQQTLTCLVTIEVPNSRWRPDPEDLRGGPPAVSASVVEVPLQSRPVTPAPKPVASSIEPPEVLEEVTEDLRARVENWHGLDFQR